MKIPNTENTTKHELQKKGNTKYSKYKIYTENTNITSKFCNVYSQDFLIKGLIFAKFYAIN